MSLSYKRSSALPAAEAAVTGGLASASAGTPKRVVMVAGEASGDLHGGALLRELRARLPGIEVTGVGGPGLREAGMQAVADTAAIAGMGLVEAADKLWALLGAYLRLRRLLRSDPPDLLVLIDFPEFNLRLARVAKRLGVPVLYYIGPQVWAWRRGRARAMGSTVDRLLVVFPFEPSWYESEGVEASYVGHPLVDCVRPTRAREETLSRYGLDPERKTVVLLPGSRDQEVRRLLPPLVRAAEILGTQRRYQFAAAVAPMLDPAQVERVVRAASVPIAVVAGDTYNLIHASDLALVASGTATLETALLERPMVIAYRVAPLTYALARLLVRVPFIGMPNLIARRKVVPELVQGEATGERIAAEARTILETPVVRDDIVAGLRDVRMRLGSGGAAARAAEVALEMLEHGG